MDLSQAEIEKRTGLLRCYISLVEDGHTMPAAEMIEKFACALEVPFYQLFYDGEKPPVLPNIYKRKTEADIAWGSTGKKARLLQPRPPAIEITRVASVHRNQSEGPWRTRTARTLLAR
jgi:transcriptional regulator with XRE-family HTH domain